jgi:hypothetical protein
MRTPLSLTGANHSTVMDVAVTALALGAVNPLGAAAPVSYLVVVAVVVVVVVVVAGGGGRGGGGG